MLVDILCDVSIDYLSSQVSGRPIAENQFDTIYHEHFSYFSFITIERLATHHNLKLIDVDELPTHRGSMPNSTQSA